MHRLDVKARIAYIRGLVEGSDVAGDERWQTVWSNLLTVCDELADSIDALSSTVADLEEYLAAVDQDLADLEDEVDTDADLVVLECSHCGETFWVDEDVLVDQDTVLCPKCGRAVAAGGLDGGAVPAASKAVTANATGRGDERPTL